MQASTSPSAALQQHLPSRISRCTRGGGRRPLGTVIRSSVDGPPAKVADPAWRTKARPIQPGSSYPAKEFCSNCGLCDTYYVAHVKEACAFLGDGALGAAVEREGVGGRLTSG